MLNGKVTASAGFCRRYLSVDRAPWKKALTAVTGAASGMFCEIRPEKPGTRPELSEGWD